VRTLLYLPANAFAGRAREIVTVDPIVLAAALIVDTLQGLGGLRGCRCDTLQWSEAINQAVGVLRQQPAQDIACINAEIGIVAKLENVSDTAYGKTI
jgi:hypothetical protein